VISGKGFAFPIPAIPRDYGDSGDLPNDNLSTQRGRAAL